MHGLLSTNNLLADCRFKRRKKQNFNLKEIEKKTSQPQRNSENNTNEL
jgi:hypothetical protein